LIQMRHALRHAALRSNSSRRYLAAMELSLIGRIVVWAIQPVGRIIQQHARPI